MISIIKGQIEELQKLFHKYKMGKVWLFGSALNEHQFGSESDIDFLYEPNKSIMTTREFLDNPSLLQNELEIFLDKKVDLVRNLPFRNPYLKAEIDKNRVLIFEYGERTKEVFI